MAAFIYWMLVDCRIELLTSGSFYMPNISRLAYRIINECPLLNIAKFSRLPNALRFSFRMFAECHMPSDIRVAAFVPNGTYSANIRLIFIYWKIVNYSANFRITIVITIGTILTSVILVNVWSSKEICAQKIQIE